MEQRVQSIDEVRKQVIDTSLIISSMIGTLAYLLSLTRWFSTGFQSIFIIEFFVIISVIIIAIKRSVISNTIKIYVIISLIFLFSLSDALTYGLLSSVRVYLILIPFFAIFYFSFLHTIIIYIVTIFSFLLIGYLHHEGILSIPDSYEPAMYINRMYPWVIIGVHISIVAVIVFMVTRKFLNAYSEFIQALNNSNKIIKESERNYREIFNSTHDAIFIQEADTGRILDVNDSMLRMFRIPDKASALNLNISELSSEDPAYSESEIQKKLYKTSHEGTQLFEWKSRRINNEIFWTEVSLQSSEIGGIGRILAVVRDISMRKESEEVIRESQALFRKIIELGPFAVVLTDNENRYIMVNEPFCRDTGFTMDELLQKTPDEIGLSIEMESQEKVADLIKKYKKVENIEATLTGKNGRKIDILYSGVEFLLNGQPVILSSPVNITERKIIEKELEKHRNNLELMVQERTEELAATNEELTAVNEELSATNDELFLQKEELKHALDQLKRTQDQLIQSEKMASLGIMASGIAHEINNPLNFISAGISGLESFLTESYPGRHGDFLPYFNGIHEGVKRAAAIVKSLGHYSRSTDSPAVLCDIHEIINNCLVILQPEIKNKIDIQRYYAPNLTFPEGNEGKLHQAFLNILANAAQAIQDDGQIRIRTSENKGHLQIEFTDTGAGISKKNLPRIFDLFFTTKDPGKGSGLGLSITYDIIREHKGTINIDSEEGSGTTVRVQLPIKNNKS